jgi:hypothetical protein
MVSKITWTNWRGRQESREVNDVLDIRDHGGEPGWAMLAIAANTHLSVADLLRLLEANGVGRSRSWVQRRRWMFQQPDAKNSPGTKPNKDGKDARAIQILRANPKMSVRQLARELLKSGIVRSREWVRRHRCG